MPLASLILLLFAVIYFVMATRNWSNPIARRNYLVISASFLFVVAVLAIRSLW